ncbi:hypothetical protein ACLOJK_041068 [Asimina triloba]
MQQQKTGRDNSWLLSLLSQKFFIPCFLHESSRKSEKNIFCLDCRTTICPHCLPPHHSHRLLQVRRYVYQDVIRLVDIEGLFDCGFVQSYTTNSAKVIFLNQRPQTRPFKGSASVEYLVQYEGCTTTTSRYAHACENSRTSSDFGCTQIEALDGGQMTPSSVLDGGVLLHTSSGSSGNGDGGCMTVGCTATSETVWRKKRTRTVVVESNDSNTPRRRKGIPHRSALWWAARIKATGFKPGKSCDVRDFIRAGGPCHAMPGVEVDRLGERILGTVAASMHRGFYLPDHSLTRVPTPLLFWQFRTFLHAYVYFPRGWKQIFAGKLTKRWGQGPPSTKLAHCHRGHVLAPLSSTSSFQRPRLMTWRHCLRGLCLLARDSWATTNLRIHRFRPQ